MKVNKILLLVAFIIVFLLGALLVFHTPNPPFQSCRYNGKTYKSGEGFPAEDGCNNCGCENGEVMCTLMACVK